MSAQLDDSLSPHNLAEILPFFFQHRKDYIIRPLTLEPQVLSKVRLMAHA